MRIIAVTSAKGGVGKSTICAQLGAAIAVSGARTLLVDLDPQSALSSMFGFSPGEVPSGPEQFGRGGSLTYQIYGPMPELRVLPTDPSRDTLEQSFAPGALRRAARAHRWVPEFVLLDLAPSLEPLTQWGLCEADSAIVVVQATALSVRTVPQLLRRISAAEGAASIEGILINRYGTQHEFGDEIADKIEQTFSGWVFPAQIPEDLALQRASMFGRPVFWEDSTAASAQAFHALARDLMARHGVSGVQLHAVHG